MALSRQVVSYNGYTFTDCQVGYQQTAEYDATGRTLQGYRTLFNCRCVIFDTTAAGLQTQRENLEQALAQPRQRFTWDAPGGGTIFDVSPTGGSGSTPSYDRRWGPKARNVAIEQITGGVSARVRFEVECFVTSCITGSPQDLEEAWAAYSYSSDRNFLTTRNVNGQYRWRSPLNAGTNAATGSLFPPLPDGFYRETEDYSLSNDGSVMTWRVSDKQVWRTLPQPLTDGNATFSLTQTGGIIRKTLSGQFSAPYDQNKNTIVDFITALIKARFPAAFNVVSGVNEFLTQMNLTNHEFENTVSFSVASTMSGVSSSGGGSTFQFLNLTNLGWADIADVTNSGSVPWSASSGSATLYSQLGTGNLLPAPFDPLSVCSSGSYEWDTFYGSTSDTNTAGYLGGTAITPGGGTGLSNFVNNNSAAQQSAPYLSFQDTWAFLMDRHVVNLSVISSSNNSAVDIAQQTANPSLRIIQIGFARRLGASPVVPPPPFVGSSNVTPYVTKEEIRPKAPQFNSDGTTGYTEVSWVREVVCTTIRSFENTASLSDTNTTVVAIPYSPIFSSRANANIYGTNGGSVQGVIDGVTGASGTSTSGTIGLDGSYKPSI